MIYPTTSELDTFLTAVGIKHTGWSMSAAVQSGIDAWEDLTDWHPFLNSGAGVDQFFAVENTRKFRIPNTGLIGFTSLELAGVTLLADQYVLYPQNRLPTRTVDFLNYVNAYFMIRGAKLGYTASLTQEEYDVIMILMAMNAVSSHTAGGMEISSTISSGAKMKDKVGAVETWYQDATAAGLLTAVQDQADIQGWGSRVVNLAKLRRRVAVA